MRLALLSDLQLCTIPPAIIDVDERGSSNTTQSLHDQYQQYALQIHDFGEQRYQYCVPLLDLTVAAGDEPLSFGRRASKDVSDILPQRRSSCRLIVFPQTRFSFLEDEVHQSVPPKKYA